MVILIITCVWVCCWLAPSFLLSVFLPSPTRLSWLNVQHLDLLALFRSQCPLLPLPGVPHLPELGSSEGAVVLAGPQSTLRHTRSRCHGVCHKLSRDYMGTHPESFWHFCLWSFLGLGNESSTHPQLRPLLDHQHHMGAHRVVLHAPPAKLCRVLVGSSHSWHPIVQRRGHLAWHDCVSLFRDAYLSLGQYQGYPHHHRQAETGCFAVHSGQLDVCALVWPQILFSEGGWNLPLHDSMAAHRIEHIFPEAYLRIPGLSSSQLVPDPLHWDHHCPHSSAILCISNRHPVQKSRNTVLGVWVSMFIYLMQTFYVMSVKIRICRGHINSKASGFSSLDVLGLIISNRWWLIGLVLQKWNFCQNWLTLMAFQTCMNCVKHKEHICGAHFEQLTLTMKVSGVQCCFGPHSLSLCKQKHYKIFSAVFRNINKITLVLRDMTAFSFLGELSPST